MCGECGANGETVTCRMANNNPPFARPCRLRFLYCLQPYGSPPVDVTFPLPQSPLDLVVPSNTHTFMEDFITQDGGSNSASPPTVNNWNRSNPFTRELLTWPVRIHDCTVILQLIFFVHFAGASAVLCGHIPSYCYWQWVCLRGQSTNWSATKLIHKFHWEEDLLWHTQHLTVWHELQVVWTVCRELLWSSVCYILFWGGRSVHLWQWRQHSVCESRGWPTEQLWYAIIVQKLIIQTMSAMPKSTNQHACCCVHSA